MWGDDGFHRLGQNWRRGPFDGTATCVRRQYLGRVHSIQYLRGIAATAVLLAHAIAYPGDLTSVYLTVAGRFGVILFFVISGFIITVVTGRDGFDPLDFLKKRLVRVVPYYWAMTLVTALMALAAPTLFRRTGFDIGNLFNSLLFIPYYGPMLPEGYPTLEPVLKLGWTLNYEMLFYLSFAALFFLSAWRRALLLTVIFSLLYLSSFLVEYESAPMVFYARYYLLFFCSGMFLGLAHLDGMVSRLTVSQLRGIIFVTVGVGIFITTASPVLNDGVRDSLICAFSFGLVLAGLAIELKGHLPKSDFLERLGDASYSIYLVHMFWIGFVSAVGRRLTFMPSNVAYGVTVIVAFVGGVAFGMMAYHLIERPLTNFVRGRLQRPRSAVPA